MLDQWRSLALLHTHVAYSSPTTRASGLIDLKIEYKEYSGSHGFALQVP